MGVQFSAGDIVRLGDGLVHEVIATWGDWVWLKAESPLIVNDNDCEFVARTEQKTPMDAH